MPRDIGLHLRLTSSFMDAAYQALALEIPIFQCFLIDQVNRARISVNHETVAQFNAIRHSFKHVFIHGSYWVNLAHLGSTGYRILKRELHIAHLLGITHIILHPGSAVTLADHQGGIESVASVLNEMNRRYPHIMIVLENTAHGGKTVGSNLHDLHAIKQLLDFPDRVAFCIDTAHAYAYGYDLSDHAKQQEFIALIDTTIGLDRLVLIHLNDSFHAQGSCIDKHAIVGEGLIGKSQLQSFVLSQQLKNLPIILELPLVSEAQERDMLQEVRSWHL